MIPAAAFFLDVLSASTRTVPSCGGISISLLLCVGEKERYRENMRIHSFDLVGERKKKILGK